VSTVHQPSVKELRAVFAADARRRSFVCGVSLVLLLSLVSAGSFAGVLLVPYFAVKILLSIVLGLGISLMFVIGHDACHDSLTPSHTLNQVLGRLCFWPTLHPYVCWDLGHNRLHHGWTNLKGVDYVYPPFSVEEFQKLPAWRRALERIYRTVPGIGLFYFVEVWWKHMLVPRREDLAKLGKLAFVMDLLLVLAFFAAEVFFACWFAPSGGHAMMNIACAILIPYGIWNWLMAFVTIQHHTHPKAPWFRNVEEWSFFHGQVHGTIHVRLPRVIELLFHNILDHTAHHVDPKIPLYHLPSCQKRLEETFSDDVVIEHSSIPALARVLRVCKLYDYDRHCWLDFEGKPSAPPVPLQRWARPRSTAQETAGAAR
jgi:omega-6 fatty acid desaturase (delta-12 desaturase)